MNTFIFTVDQNGEAVVAQTYCKTVIIRENDQTVNVLQPYLVNTPGGSQQNILPGDKFTFIESGYAPGTIVGYVQLINTASVNFAQIEVNEWVVPNV